MKAGLSPFGKELWWKEAVFYQVYPRSFSDSSGNGIGDLEGVISRLDYLNDGTPDSLGIDAIWFSPFFPGPDHDFGYDITDFCDIDPRFGSLETFDRLVREAHRREIRVILDLVVNHTSIEHPWFAESRASRDNPRRDWYLWKDGRDGGRRPPNNWRNSFFGSAWTFDPESGQYYLHSFLKEQPDLNWRNPAVREAVAGVIRFWLERGVDGFRLDVAHHYCKDELFRDNPPFYSRRRTRPGLPRGDRTLLSNLMDLLALPELQVGAYNRHRPETHRVLKEFRKIFDAYPAKTSVGEIIGTNPAVVASYYGEKGDELHLNFYFELLNCRWKAGAFRRCIEGWEKALPAGAWPAYALSNHDVTRAVSRYGEAGGTDRRARLLMLMLLTLRGTPFIYYGEEIGMREARLKKRDLLDPVGLRWYPLHRGRDGCRTPMQWNSNKNAGFTTAEPWLPLSREAAERNVWAQEKNPRSLLSFVKKLIWARKALLPLREGCYESLVEGVPQDCYCYLRHSESGTVAVCLNFSTAPRPVNPAPPGGTGRLVLSTENTRREGPVAFPLLLSPLEGCLVEL